MLRRPVSGRLEASWGGKSHLRRDLQPHASFEALAALVPQNEGCGELGESYLTTALARFLGTSLSANSSGKAVVNLICSIANDELTSESSILAMSFL